MASDPGWYRSQRFLLVAALVALLVFAALAIVISGTWAHDRDASIHSWFVSHRVPLVTGVARTLTRMATAAALAALVVVGVATHRSRPARDRLVSAATLLAIQLLGMLARLLVANGIGRARPPRSDWATSASGYAFPSGHTATATIAAGLVAWTLCGAVPNRPAVRAVICLIATGWAVVIGFTRVYLGVHWPTDVVGGWAFGTAWTALGVLVGWRWLPAATSTEGTNTRGHVV